MPDKVQERRVIAGLSVEKRANDDDESQTIVGYAAVFNTETDIGGYFREKVAPGAFARSLKGSDVHALYNHDYGVVLGRAKSGTLRLKEDEHGLRAEIDLPDTNDARDLATKIARGDIDEMSFQFSMRDGAEEWDDTGKTPLRTIKDVGELFDVSVCPRGAYPTTECGMRSLEQFRKQHNYGAAKRRLRTKLHLGIMSQENGKRA